jgi:threonine dehydratase
LPVTRADIDAAAVRIAPHVVRTPVLNSAELDAWIGVATFSKAEHRQHAGAFKYRGATNAVRSLDNASAERGVAAHSSGNHAAALALAARARGIPCTVVMPYTASPAKQRLVREHGATIVECNPTEAARAATLRDVIARTSAIEVHPYDDDRVIAGAGTAALELLNDEPDIEVVMTPVGGGGLLSGTCITAASVGCRVLAGEPAGADDAFRSLAAGELIPQLAPETIADGLLTSLSARTFSIIRAHVDQIVRVSESEIEQAQHAVLVLLGERIEPSSAVAVAALRAAVASGAIDRHVRCGIILTGGNVAENSKAR